MDSRQADALIDQFDASGLAVGLVADGEVMIRCRGEVAGERVHPHSIMYGASLTKQVIGVALTLAVRAGQVGYHDRIREWITELPLWMEPVLVRHLVHHTSGLPGVAVPEHAAACDNAMIIDRLTHLTGQAPATPGREYAYSNTGYVLLAEVITRAGGRPIPQPACLRSRDGSADGGARPTRRSGGSRLRLGCAGHPYPGRATDHARWKLGRLAREDSAVPGADPAERPHRPP